ncbi:MAG: hypothetical protein P1P85_00605, partial [Patescibacteria group bacterium]|nr:hypothetical protein [Patescibacteria group bacterium]
MKNEKHIKIKKITASKMMLFFCIFFLFSLSINIQTSKAVGFNENDIFVVDLSYDKTERQQIHATLKKISSYAYFYVEDDYYNNLPSNLRAKLESDIYILAKSFDDTIYPNIKKTYGTEWTPGIDNDSKITILLTETKENVGGYFNPNDEYKKERITNEKSNEKEMIYLNITFIGNDRIKSFLAHEFQHMITWYHKTKLKNITEEIWLNEARSEYASTAIGYDDNYSGSNLKARISNFKTNPTDSLTEWQNKIYDYSSVNLFSQYLSDQFGNEIFKRMIENDASGIESIDKSISDLGYKDQTFKTTFVNWTITNYLNGVSPLLKNKYNYKNISFENFHIIPNNNFELNIKEPIFIKNSIKDWSSEYYKFNFINNANNSKIRISFKGQNSGNFTVPYIILRKDNIYEINELNLNTSQDSIIYIPNYNKDILSITIIPTSHKKTSNFGSDIDKYDFSFSIDIIKSIIYKENSLLRSLSSSRVYIVKNGKKRWIPTEAIFN